jgi:hypothetical protein
MVKNKIIAILSLFFYDFYTFSNFTSLRNAQLRCHEDNIITPSIKKNETKSHFSNGPVADKNNFDDDNRSKILSGRCNFGKKISNFYLFYLLFYVILSF